ncbi:MAG: helix-turn-helix transcriptional regulator [Chitinophagaceae bacterium]|nr:helix-turn-helix transcriptional regulator [Chitinophagaceae bacterium]MCW5929518.1 helix-turn-helix transcriptional regulator [Chitinophagaceae bacterium]
MKARPTLDGKRKETNIISTPLCSISFHKGTGSFSIHCQYRKNFPIALIMVSRGFAISVKASAAASGPIHTNRCRLFFEKGLRPGFSYKGTEKWEFFEIRISPLLLKELPASICPAWDSFMKKLEKNKATVLSESDVFYRNDVKDITYSLLQDKIAEPVLREKYFDLKVQEILLHVVNELLSPTQTDPEITDREHMLALKIKRVLDSAQTSRDFTIQYLSEVLDINETTLKKSFKKVTGMSIYRYYLHKQMTLAQRLLNEGCPVTDVALKVGYSTAGHFSHQFKKYFGTNPKNFKKRL